MQQYIRAFLREKPFFFALLRPKEVSLYQKYKPFKKPILDLGCGDGFFAEVGFGHIDVGIDPDRKSIEEAKKRNVYGVAKYYNGKKIPYPDEYFATVLCNSTYEHISNIDEVLQETARVLGKNGNLYFTTVTNTWPDYLFQLPVIGELYKDYFIQKSKHWNMYSVPKWDEKLKKLGLKITEHQYYLDSKAVIHWFEVAHYASVSSLLTKKLFGKWVLFPQKNIIFSPVIGFIEKHTKRNTRKGPYLFIAAKKIK